MLFDLGAVKLYERFFFISVFRFYVSLPKYSSQIAHIISRTIKFIHKTEMREKRHIKSVCKSKIIVVITHKKNTTMFASLNFLVTGLL